jgi:hypothetical protein
VESAIRRRRGYALIHSQRSHLLLTTTYKIKQHSSSSTVETWVALPWNNNQWSSSIYSWYYSVKRNIYLFILSKRRKKQCRGVLRKKKREEMWSRHALTDLTGNRLAGRGELQRARRINLITIDYVSVVRVY